MKNNIHPFSQNNFSAKKEVLNKIGIRGKQAMDFAKLDLTQRINGLYIGGHPAVVERLRPLVAPRPHVIEHPAAW